MTGSPLAIQRWKDRQAPLWLPSLPSVEASSPRAGLAAGTLSAVPAGDAVTLTAAGGVAAAAGRAVGPAAIVVAHQAVIHRVGAEWPLPHGPCEVVALDFHRSRQRHTQSGQLRATVDAGAGSAGKG